MPVTAHQTEASGLEPLGPCYDDGDPAPFPGELD